MDSLVRHKFLDITQGMLSCYLNTFTRKAKSLMEVAFHPETKAKSAHLNDKNLQQMCVKNENQKNIVTKEHIFTCRNIVCMCSSKI